MPSTSRSSALDTFMSPKSKISLGLKLFRDLVVDVYRPYHPCTGVVLATENGVGGRAKAAPCTPVIDLPVDCVRANVTVANFVMARLVDLKQREDALVASTAAVAGPSPPPLSSAPTAADAVEKAGQEALQSVTEKVRRAALVERLRMQWAQLGVKVVECPKACVHVIVPFSMTEVDVRSATKPLLYLRVVYDC